jgi:hypothetical protein
MSYRSSRHGDYRGRSERYRDSYRYIDRCDPPISWPHRPAPAFSNLPGISIFWPMPLIFPILPSLGGWGAMRSNSEESNCSYRRFGMNRYRYCEPQHRRHDRCCERCGCYECRCERERCNDCGCYECRCERVRCDDCGYYECRCERCAKCGQRECQCREYCASRRVEVCVEAPEGVNYKVEISEQSFDCEALPRVGTFTPLGPSTLSGYAQIYPEVVKITVKLAMPAEVVNTTPPTPVVYSAAVQDAYRITKIWAHLTVVVY